MGIVSKLKLVFLLLLLAFSFEMAAADNQTENRPTSVENCNENTHRIVTTSFGVFCQAISKDEAYDSNHGEKLIQSCTDTAEMTAQCCSKDLANSSCDLPEVATFQQYSQQIVAVIGRVSGASISASCGAYQEATRLTQLATGVGAAICINKANACNTACTPSPAMSNCAGDPVCEQQLETLKAKKWQCQKTGAGNTALSILELAGMEKMNQWANDCRDRVKDDVKCNDDSFAINNPLDCDLRITCLKPEYQGHASCADLPNAGSTSIASNAPDPNAKGDTGIDGCDDQTLETCFSDEAKAPEGVPINNDSADSGGFTNSGGSTPGRDVSGGGSAGGNEGDGDFSEDKNIIKGSSTGNGYVGRFKNSGGGGGGYRNAISGGKTSSSKSNFGFNLKKYLPKSKVITKGVYKNFNRLPSGHLMAPKSFDIFKMHHRSYENACLKNKAIKGCDPGQRKKLGSSISIAELNAQYRVQLFLPKEINNQRMNQANIKIKSIKNEMHKSARTTYYQLQYLKENGIKSLALRDSQVKPSSVNSKSNKKNNKKWLKMNNWVNAKIKQTAPHQSLPNSKRVPADNKKNK